VALVAISVAHGSSAPKIFGVGLSKTGSTSLGKALEMLGYKNIHNDRAFVPFLYPEGQYNFTGRYDHVDAVEDLPTAMYYEQMLHEYPNARFVLTVRDAEAWYTSFSQHQKDITELYGGVLPFRLQKITEMAYGTVEDDKETWVQHFNAHNAHVQEVIPAGQLLVMDITKGQGWKELCQFLGRQDGQCAHPEAAFPAENTKEDRQKMYLEKGATNQVAPIKADSKYAYASLLAHPSLPERHDYLVSFLVAAESIRRTGSQHDIVALVYGKINAQDQDLLEQHDIVVVPVGSFGAALPHNPEAFDGFTAAIYRAKIRVLQLVQYDMVLFFDSDVVFHKNCDDLFNTDFDFVGRAGSNSPFNAGFFLIRPSWQALMDINDISIGLNFDTKKGWNEYGPIPDWREEAKGSLTDWSFYGGSVEQGLLYYYYFCYHQADNADLVAETMWDDRVTHFVGFMKPFLLGKKSVDSLPKRYRAAAQQWTDLYQDIAVHKKHTGKSNHASRRDLQDPLALSGNEFLPEGYPLNDPYPPGPSPPPSPPGNSLYLVL